MVASRPRRQGSDDERPLRGAPLTPPRLAKLRVSLDNADDLIRIIGDWESAGKPLSGDPTFPELALTLWPFPRRFSSGVDNPPPKAQCSDGFPERRFPHDTVSDCPAYERSHHRALEWSGSSATERARHTGQSRRQQAYGHLA